MSKTVNIRTVTVVLQSLLLAAAFMILPFGMTFAADPSQSGPEELLLQRLQSETYDVSLVEIEGQLVRVKCRQSALQDQTTLPYTWVDMMMIVAEELPQVERVTLEISYLQEPFVELSASGEQIRAVMLDQLALTDFMASLNFQDNRSLETVLASAFVEYGYPFAGFEIEEGTLRFPLLVEYVVPYLDLAAALGIASQAAVHEPELEIVEIVYWQTDGEQITLRAQAGDLTAYHNEELPLIAMLAGLEVMNEPSATRSPVLGRALGLLNLFIAGIAAAFYGAIAIRLRSWSLVLKAGGLVVLPPLVAGVIMLILML